MSAWYSVVILGDNQNSFHLNYLPQAFMGFQISNYSTCCFVFWVPFAHTQCNVKPRCSDGSPEKLKENHQRQQHWQSIGRSWVMSPFNFPKQEKGLTTENMYVFSKVFKLWNLSQLYWFCYWVKNHKFFINTDNKSKENNYHFGLPLPSIPCHLAWVTFAFLQELVCLCQCLLNLESLRTLIFKILNSFALWLCSAFGNSDNSNILK